MQIFVSGSLLPRRLKFSNVTEDTTTRQIKDKVAAKIEGPFFLKFHGKSLKADETLVSQQVVDQSEITVVKKTNITARAQAAGRIKRGEAVKSRAHHVLNQIAETVDRTDTNVGKIAAIFDPDADTTVVLRDGESVKAARSRLMNLKDGANMTLRRLKGMRANATASEAPIDAPAPKKRRASTSVVSPELAAAKEEAKTIKAEIPDLQKTFDDLKAEYFKQQEGTEECQSAMEKYLESKQNLETKQKELREANKRVKEMATASSSDSRSAAPRAPATPQRAQQEGHDIE